VRAGRPESAAEKAAAATAAWPESKSFRLGKTRVLEQALIRLRAEILLLEGKPAEAIAFMEKEFHLSIPTGHSPPSGPYAYLFLNFPLVQDVVARAYEKMGNLDQAIEAYRKLIDFDPNGPDRRMRNPVYHYRLGKLLEARGLKELAAVEYRKLLEIWKDADPGIPELADAKKRLGAIG
jgi:tetratricopeptide (TPR) repeat protein